MGDGGAGDGGGDVVAVWVGDCALWEVHRGLVGAGSGAEEGILSGALVRVGGVAGDRGRPAAEVGPVRLDDGPAA